jgi:hypothetical protein
MPPWRGKPTIDCHDRVFSGEGHRVSSTRVFLGFHVPGKGSRGHEVHHVAVLEPVLDGVHVVAVGLLENSLEVVCQWARGALDVTSSGRNVLHVGAVHLLVVVIVIPADGSSGLLRTPLLTLLAAFDIRHGALDGNVGWRRPTTIRDRFPAA